MLVLLPPSEGKTSASTGSSLDFAQLAPFASELHSARESVLDALRKISAQPDALELLGVGPSLNAEVAANTSLRENPCAPAYLVYSGVLYESGQLALRGLDYQPSPSFAVYVQSALFGLVDLASLIPAYRLSMDTKLGELGALATWWKRQLTPLLGDFAGHKVVVDCRSGSYIKALPGLETKQTEYTLVRVNVVRERAGKRTVVSHNAKKFRGVLAGALMEQAANGALEDSLAGVLKVAQSLVGSAEVIGVETSVEKGHTALVIVTQ